MIGRPSPLSTPPKTRARVQTGNELVYAWARLPDFEDFRVKPVPQLGPSSFVLETSSDPRNARFGLESKEAKDGQDSEWKFSVRYHDLSKSTPGLERIITFTLAGLGGTSPSTSPRSNSTVTTSSMFPGVQVRSVDKASGVESITPIGTVLARSVLSELRVAPNPAYHKPEQVSVSGAISGATAASSASLAVASTSDKPVMISGRGSSEDVD